MLILAVTHVVVSMVIQERIVIVVLTVSTELIVQNNTLVQAALMCLGLKQSMESYTAVMILVKTEAHVQIKILEVQTLTVISSTKHFAHVQPREITPDRCVRHIFTATLLGMELMAILAIKI
jgi:hypothetical protein